MKETWKMIALLAIAIGGLLAYAFIPEQVAENIPLKQIGMDALTGKSEAELAEEEKADSMIKEPVDTAAQRVLIFGDSMSEYLGLRLADYANKNGHKLTCITWVEFGHQKLGCYRYPAALYPTYQTCPCLCMSGQHSVCAAHLRGACRPGSAVLFQIYQFHHWRCSQRDVQHQLLPAVYRSACRYLVLYLSGYQLCGRYL